jgi:hypothetical protein
MFSVCYGLPFPRNFVGSDSCESGWFPNLALDLSPQLGRSCLSIAPQRMDDKRVLVAIRVRPKLENALNALQSNERYQMEAAAKTSDRSIRLSDGKIGRDGKTHNFSYDLVFDKDCTQLDVYEETTLDAVDAVLMGCNATVVTYGQTGSGKTYTVLGSVKKNPLTNDIITSDTGLFLRALKDILSYAEHRSNDVHLVVGLSVIEIYLDEVRDLLSSEATPPTVKLSVIGDSLSMPNLTYKPIEDLNDAVQAYRLANARRVSRATAANDTSSRSHALFSIEVFQQVRTAANPLPMSAKELCELREKQQLASNTDSPSVASNVNRTNSFAFGPAPGTPSTTPATQTPGIYPASPSGADGFMSPISPSQRASHGLLQVAGKPPIVFSKLVLTDLAGSEKMKNSNVRGEGLEELKKINGSLTALGNVVHSLYEGAKYIPYRDSKLTILLRESFAVPNSRIVMIANASPTVLTFDETLSTLFFADKVKGMKVENPQGAEVARLEVEYLNTMKTLEEIAADLRIAGVMHDYAVGGIRVRGPSEAVCRPLCIIKRPTGQSQSSRDRELKAQFGEASLTAVDGYNAARCRVEGMIAELMSSRKSDEAETRDVVGELQHEIEEAQSSVADLEAARSALEPKAASLPPVLKETAATIEVLDKEIVEMERRVFEANREHDEAWTEEQRVHRLQQSQWSSSKRFAEGCLTGWQLRLDYTNQRSTNMELMRRTAETKHDSETADVTHWIRSAVVRIARNAVATGISKARRAPSTRPAARSVSSRNASNVSSEVATRRIDPEAANMQQPGTPSADDAADNKRATGKRRGTLYDQPSLLKEILSYVQYGCTILKYGRSGAPHYRLFYVLMSEEEGARLCWDEEDDGRRLGKGSSIALSGVTRIILGRFTAIFDRLPDTEGFYNSFSLEYISRQQTRTLDLVCDTDAELESWVIALCSLTKKSPQFGGPLVTKNTPALAQLSPDEESMCIRWHVPPDVFMSCKRRVEDVRHRSKHPVVKMSPGDVRMLTQLDIFRASAVWKHFAAVGLVENPFEKLYSYVEFDV